MRLKYTPPARRQFEVIAAYLRENAPEYAVGVVTKIRATAERLLVFPYIGHTGMAPHTYEITVPRLPYVIVYEVTKKEIQILGIYHGRQSR